MEDRRKFIKQMGALFVGVGSLAATVSTVNEEVESGKFVSPKKSISHGLYVISYGEIYGSRDFPIRPRNTICTDGQLIWFVWPSEKGDARGYVRQYDQTNIQAADLIVHRIRIGKPEPPYYLYWHNGDYWMYKTPGSLVKRASWLIHFGDGEADILQALSDFRFAAILNAIFLDGKEAEEVMAKMAEIDNELRKRLMTSSSFDFFIDQYKNILTLSRKA